MTGINVSQSYWDVPVRGVRLPNEGTLAFGTRRSASHVHQGIDLFAPEGTPVWAPTCGAVVWATTKWRSGFSGYGKVVVLETEGGLHVLHSHLSDVYVQSGDRIHRGVQLGTVGRTAFRRDDRTANFRHSKPHLHFEVSENAYPMRSEAPRLDPLPFFGPAPHRRTTPGSEAKPIVVGSRIGGVLVGAGGLATLAALAVAQ